jgi:hypothetical protein
MNQQLFVNAAEVAKTLQVSKPHAYKLVRELNEELQQKGYLIIAGRVSRRFFEEKFFYGGGVGSGSV